MPMQNKNITTVSANQPGHTEQTEIWRPPTCFFDVIEIIADHCRENLAETLIGIVLLTILFLVLFFI